MFKIWLLSLQLSISIIVNYIIYFLKFVPLLGKAIPDTLYRQTTAKTVLALVLLPLKFLFDISVKSGLALGIFVLGPMVLMDNSMANTQLFYHYFFFFFFVTGPFATNIIFQAKDINAYTLINIFKVDARHFYVSRVLFTVGKTALRYLLLLAIVSLITEISLLQSLMLTGYIVMMALIWEYLLLVLHGKTGINIFAKQMLLLGALFLSIVIAYTLPLMGLTLRLEGILSSGYTFLFAFALASLASWHLCSFDNYSQVAKVVMDRETLAQTAETLKNLNFIDVNLDEKQLTKAKVNGADHLQGYALFNHLFFSRHKKIITKPIINRVIFIGLLAIALWSMLLALPTVQESAGQTLLSSAPYFIFIMYFLSTGERFSKALFFNCDRYMLREAYYRDKGALLHNFTLRLRKSIGLNLLPALALVVLILGTGLVLGMGRDIIKLFPLAISILSLSLFFSTHYLFIYYILQPYTVDLKKSPLYFIISGLVYMICYGFIFVKTPSLVFTFAVITFTIFYAGVAILLTYNFAPKTFKLR